MSTTMTKRILNISTFVGLIACVILAIYGYQLGFFQDSSQLQAYVTKTGAWGPLFFIGLQIIQVVIPIIPGGVSCGAGVLIFGASYGFLYNYIGIVIGSFINFFLARQYGKPLIHQLISDKVYNKYISWLDNERRFERLFALAIFFPVAPDDALCLLAGISNISLKKYSLIILLGKPASIYLYSLALVYGGQFLSGLL